MGERGPPGLASTLALSPHPRPLPAREGSSIKKAVTLRLDLDVVEWFKRHAPEGGYQTEINRVLRRYVAGAGR